MIATVYEMNKKAPLNSDKWYWSKIDLVNLYKVFVERKLHIYLTEKQKADITNTCIVDDQEVFKLFILFEKFALVAILPPSFLKSLHSKKIEEEIKTFLGKVQTRKDKTGVVMNVVDSKLHFSHGMF